METWKQELYASDYGRTYLAHHGIKGQQWGVRRFQNEDGSLTPEGEQRYGSASEYEKALNKLSYEYSAADTHYYDETLRNEQLKKSFAKQHNEKKKAMIEKWLNESDTTLSKIKTDMDIIDKDIDFLLDRIQKEGKYDFKIGQQVIMDAPSTYSYGARRASFKTRKKFGEATKLGFVAPGAGGSVSSYGNHYSVTDIEKAKKDSAYANPNSKIKRKQERWITYYT